MLLPCLCLDQCNYLLKHPATSIAELPKHNRPAGAFIVIFLVPCTCVGQLQRYASLPTLHLLPFKQVIQDVASPQTTRCLCN